MIHVLQSINFRFYWLLRARIQSELVIIIAILIINFVVVMIHVCAIVCIFANFVLHLYSYEYQMLTDDILNEIYALY